MKTDSGQIDLGAQKDEVGEHHHQRKRAADPEDRAAHDAGGL